MWPDHPVQQDLLDLLEHLDREEKMDILVLKAIL